nr:MBOAT family O-acyltransferase [Mangrovivirga halotolerans]
MWKWEYIGLIVLSTVVDYFVALGIESSANERRRKLLLLISLSVNLGLLFYFKYYNFFIDNINMAVAIWDKEIVLPYADVILPVGISFYTFQTLSYTIEVFMKRTHAEKNFGIFALYVSFFPQLVAGPIERPQNLLGQLRELKGFRYENIVLGLRQMLWGMFKKVVIADRLAFFVNLVYDNPDQFHGPWPIMATLFFTFQIYCDFSGYSDIAIGAARIINIDLMTNFRTPYFSKSVKEFWGRWHISLSTWFRDYVYIPLGGNRVSVFRWVLNLFITFVVSGIWHGAAWTFVIWGLIHGLAVSIESYHGVRPLFKFKFPIWVQRSYTLFLVIFAWIFFRAPGLNEAIDIIDNMLNWNANIIGEIKRIETKELYNLAIGIPLIILLLIIEMMMQWKTTISLFHKLRWVRWASYIFLLIIIALFGVFVDPSDFIYFQF